MKVDGSIPSLLNGVSQQAPPMRQVTQLEKQVNCYSTILRGLKHRPPTERVCQVAGAVGSYAHIIDRDLTEKYVVGISEGSLRVFDFAGTEKTVTFPDGVGYISGLTDPEADLTAMTINDYTFVINRKKTVAMASSPTVPTRTPEAIINIIAGNYGRTYVIRINGVEAAKYVTPVGDNANQSPGVATTVIASHLYRDLQTSLQNAAVTTDGGSLATPWNIGGGDTPQLGYAGGVWGVGIHQNALHITRYDGVDFAIAIDDGVGGSAMKVAKGAVDKFSDLPQYGPDGFRIEIGGSTSTTQDNYWVWADKGGTNNNSKVTWREAPKPGTQLSLDASTMPHVLIRNSDGTFTFKRAAWAQRKCGDGVNISPDPSFVGKPISDIFFHRNRLGLLSDDGVILSRASEFFDFFRKTATALLDDDPIDVAAAHVKVSMVRAAVPIQDNLIIFADQTQFRLAGNELLTAKTASIRPLTEYSSYSKVRPVALGNTIFFAADSPGSRQFASVHEYTYDQQRSSALSSEVTAHVPAYLPSGITQLIGMADEGVLCVLNKADRSTMYVYRYYWQGEEKVQSSWSEWNFGSGQVLAGASIHSELYLIIRRGSTTFLEKIRMDTAATDTNFDVLVSLDQRLKIAPGSISSGYWSGRMASLISLPLNPDTTKITVVGTVTGRQYTVIDRGTGYVRVSGTVTEEVYVGEAYTSIATLSTIFYRQPTGQSNTVRVDGRLQLQSLTLSFHESGYFRVEVARESGIVSSELKLLDLAPGIPMGTIVSKSGSLNVPIQGRNTAVKISIVNDSWLPHNITGATWRGLFSSTNKEQH